MSAREDILRSIRSRKAAALPRPVVYTRSIKDDIVERFIACANAANATVDTLDGLADVPLRVSELLRERNHPATAHMPPDAELNGLQWGHIGISHTAPGPDDAAVSVAPFGVAETGTLVFPSGKGQPASWHFRPGFEIAVLRAEDIVPDLESAFSRLRAKEWPRTVNLVTGPSRTGDIEQTLELGAHGPKALAILLIRERPEG
jgi:L-lactate dehydrogenase complex protein LldG